MKKYLYFITPIILFLVGFFSRFILIPDHFSSLDSVLYAVGVENYSIANGTPPSPGYFLYIFSAKFLNLFFHNTYDALILLSVIYSGLIAVVIFLLGANLFSFLTGVIASLLFLTSPVFWYKGITVYGYLNSAFFIILTAYFCWRVIQGHLFYIYWASLSYALTIGVRPQDLIPLFPLVFYVFFKVPWKYKVYALTIFIISCSLWFFPLVYISGGFTAYLFVLQKGSIYLIDNSFLGANFFQQINNHLIRMSQYFQRSYFLGIVPLIYGIGRIFYFPNWSKPNILFLCLFIFPQIIFNILIQYAEIGHGLAWGIGGFIVIAQSMVVLSEDFFNKVRKVILAFMILGVSGVNCLMFFYDFNFDIYNYDRVVFDDHQFNISDLHRLDQHIVKKFNFIRQTYPSDSLLIISSRFYSQIYYEFPNALIVRSNRLLNKYQSSAYVCQKRQCEYFKEKKVFQIPSHIRTILIFDENMLSFVDESVPSQLHKIDQKTSIKSIPVDQKRSIYIDYQKITIL